MKAVAPPDRLLHPPFAAIITWRPYPDTGLTTARWQAEIPVQDVPFAALTLTQDHLHIRALLGHSDPRGSTDAYPHAVRWVGRLYLEDGAHRAVRAALLSGRPSMPMRVFTHPGCVRCTTTVREDA